MEVISTIVVFILVFTLPVLIENRIIKKAVQYKGSRDGKELKFGYSKLLRVVCWLGIVGFMVLFIGIGWVIYHGYEFYIVGVVVFVVGMLGDRWVRTYRLEIGQEHITVGKGEKEWVMEFKDMEDVYVKNFHLYFKLTGGEERFLLKYEKPHVIVALINQRLEEVRSTAV